uniref:Uncharacterized protein n=1 Tax=Schistocephalus solidus TaxID=70667 RepID=A0A0X3PKT7_SCHSO
MDVAASTTATDDSWLSVQRPPSYLRLVRKPRVARRLFQHSLPRDHLLWVSLEPLPPSFMFFHQYLFFNFPALASNCEAPAWRASARSSSLPRAASLSSTFSMLTRIMSTTSLTWACVCWKRLLVACEGAGLPSAGGAAAFSGWFILCTSEALLHK